MFQKPQGNISSHHYYRSRSFKTLLSGTFRVRMHRICFQFRVYITQKLSAKNSYHVKKKAKMYLSEAPLQQSVCSLGMWDYYFHDFIETKAEN